MEYYGVKVFRSDVKAKVNEVENLIVQMSACCEEMVTNTNSVTFQNEGDSVEIGAYNGEVIQSVVVKGNTVNVYIVTGVADN